MKKTILQPAFFILIICLSACNRPFEKCTISGRIIGRSSTSMIFVNALDRPDPQQAKIHIPIKDSTFSYEFAANPKQAYWLIFEDDYSSPDGIHPITIFPDKEKIKLVLYDSKHIAQNKIYGGKLNNQFVLFTKELESKFDPLMKPYNDSIQVLMKLDKYLSDASKELNKKMDQTQNQDSLIVIYKKLDDLGDDAYTEPVKEINRHLNSIYKEKYSWCYNYYDQNQTIVSYYLILRELMDYLYTNYSDLSRLSNVVKSISGKYPDHPYNKAAKDLLNAFDQIKVGGEFIDFTLPDLNGNNITLSKSIEGKIALIDLWATWCGPCIAASRSMIPVYNEFKNSGFTIVGVANEIDNTNQLKKTLEREKFPWINLIELNNENGIWLKYGIPGAGGKTFLVDKDGKILAIKPTAEEVRNILIQKLK
ncbi:MAG: TlpA family protein disulfide reductase [Bacteroidales bacterium]|nr:TlpA family protein disulfide reductase [Bacteroidales bacterium]